MAYVVLCKVEGVWSLVSIQQGAQYVATSGPLGGTSSRRQLGDARPIFGYLSMLFLLSTPDNGRGEQRLATKIPSSSQSSSMFPRIIRLPL